jgi:ferritin
MKPSNEQPIQGKLTEVKADIRSLTDQIQKTYEKESEQLKKKVEQTVESIKNKKDDTGKSSSASRSLEILGSM